jgi:hypothetical protein
MQTTRSASLDTRNRHLRLHPDPSRILLTNSSFPSANPFMLSILGIYPPGGGYTPRSPETQPIPASNFRSRP